MKCSLVLTCETKTEVVRRKSPMIIALLHWHHALLFIFFPVFSFLIFLQILSSSRALEHAQSRFQRLQMSECRKISHRIHGVRKGEDSGMDLWF